MRISIAAAVMASFVLFSGATAGTVSDTFTSYYAFGDSLTDDGKLPDASLHPLSDDGRFSNGPVWAEYIAAEFDGTGKNTANLAIGGATGDDENYRPINALSTFAGQIATFASAVLTGSPLPVRTSETDIVALQPTNPGANPLVSILFGGNDMFQSADRALEKGITVQEVLENAADRVAQGIREIAALQGGTVFDDFLVLTLPGAGLADFYNDQLALNVLDLRGSGLNIIEFDSNTVYEAIVADALFNAGGVFGVTNVITPCTVTLSDPTGASCLDLGIDPNTVGGTDAVHPNAVIHRVLGTRAISALEASVTPVPLPVGLPLLLAGMGAFAMLKARRAA